MSFTNILYISFLKIFFLCWNFVNLEISWFASIFHSMSEFLSLWFIWIPFLALRYSISIFSWWINQHFLGPNLHSFPLVHSDTTWKWKSFMCSLKSFCVLNLSAQKLHLKLCSDFLNASLWRNQQLSPKKQTFSRYCLQCWTLLVWIALLCFITSDKVLKILSQKWQEYEFSGSSISSPLSRSCVWSLKSWIQPAT